VRDAEDELEIVIVKDRMLVGFDAPPLHTLYIDRPLRGVLLMQTIARANRTFGEKKEGLMVGYSPLTEHLYKALAECTTDDQEQKPVGRKTEDAIGPLRDVLDVIGSELLDGYDWRAALVKFVSADAGRGDALGLNADELAFYDAVAANESALDEMGADKLAAIARDLVKSVRSNLTTDWAKREDVQAHLRLTIKRLLRRHGYPPDRQKAAVKKVIEQVETYAEDWQPAS
jgi:type I site-specific restriction-modification system R (restriction) subunit